MGDWTDSTYVISQVLTILCYAVFVGTYFMKKRGRILLCVTIANAVQGVSFVLLGSWVGVGVCIIGIARNCSSAIIDKKKESIGKNKIARVYSIQLAVILSAMVILTAFTARNFSEWFACFATSIYTISIWQKKVFVYRFLGILVSICWIIYHFTLGSLFGVILESVCLAIVIAGVVQYLLKQKKETKSIVPAGADNSN